MRAERLQGRAAVRSPSHRAARDGAAGNARLSHSGESAYLDLSIDPSERATGSIISPRPDLANYAVFGLGRVVTPDAWLSTWSGLSSYAKMSTNLPKVTVPTLVVGANADPDIFLSDVKAEFEASGAADKQLTFIEGADHFMRAGGIRSDLGDPRPRLMKVVVDWTRERFAP